MPGVIGFSTKLLPIRKRGNKLEIEWFEVIEEIDDLIEYVETLVGRKKKDVWEKILERSDKIYLDVKKRDVLLFSLFRYYGFMAVDPFRKYYPFRGKTIPVIDSLDKLRVEVFSKRFKYGLDDLQQVLIDTLPFEIPDDVENVVSSLFGDFEENKILKRFRKKPSKEEIVGLMNFYSLVVLSRLLIEGKIEIFNELPASVIKRIIFTSKFNGIYVEFLKKSGSVMVSLLEGNKELGSVSQQNNISKTVGVILKELVLNKLEFQLEFIIKLENRENKLCVFKLDSNEIVSHFIDEGVRTGFYEEGVLDSDWEQEFFKNINKNRFGWEIILDPHVIIEKNFIYVPDFVARRGDKMVLIEIAGFFTEEYLKKKSRKLSLIEKKHKLIVIAPEKNIWAFSSLNSPIIGFKSRIPVQKVLVTLEKLFEEETGKRLAETGTETILESFKSKRKSIVLIEELLKENVFHHIGEVKEWLSKKQGQIEKNTDYKVVPEMGLIKKELLQELCFQFEHIYSKESNVVINAFEEIVEKNDIPVEWTAHLLKLCGFELMYIDFSNIRVIKN